MRAMDSADAGFFLCRVFFIKYSFFLSLIEPESASGYNSYTMKGQRGIKGKPREKRK
jgi:hypothetical protein